jgi:hypothetical protein
VCVWGGDGIPMGMPDDGPLLSTALSSRADLFLSRHPDKTSLQVLVWNENLTLTFATANPVGYGNC